MNFEEIILNTLDAIGRVDFSIVGNYFLVGFGIFWIATIWWVWFDASARTTKTWAKISSVLLVILFNIFGLIIYLIIRPDQTIEGTYWEDLERRYMKYETSELGDCPKCNAQLYPGYIFCPNCGFELKVKCSQCEMIVDRNAKFCSFCGNQIRKRVVKEEILMEPEKMEEQVKATRDEITEVVESDKTRYSRKESIVTKIGESVISGYKIIGDSIVNAFKKEEKEENREEKKEEIEQNDKKKQNKKKKNKKKSKKKRK